MDWKQDKGTFRQTFQAMDYPGLKRLLRKNPGQVDRELKHRLRFLKITTFLNTPTTPWDQLFWGRRIKNAAPPDPVFVLGHWRSGTTLLHNMLARDPRFGYPTLTHVFTPKSFLTLGRLTRAYLNKILPAVRAMDEVVLGADEPQEDEFALAIMCGLSPYMEMIFPRRRNFYSRYFRLDGIDAEELALWKKTFRIFLKKMSLVDSRPMLLKSPPHTARVAMLAEMYPKAKFIHIVRNPYRVYQSMWGLYDNFLAVQHLQVVPRDVVRENMLKNYQLMFTALETDRQTIARNRFVTIRYEDLVDNPLQQIGRIYEQLQLTGLKELEPHLKKYLQSIQNYRPNKLKQLQPEEKKMVARCCAQVFSAYGYAANA